jgi:hypothetical protein
VRRAAVSGVEGVGQDVLRREARQRLVRLGLAVPADRAPRCTKEFFPRLGFQTANVAQIGIEPSQERCIAPLRRRQTDRACISAEMVERGPGPSGR